MSYWRLVLASLVHYRWLNLAVLAGVALTAAILSGSLVVGDSVRESLRRNSLARISNASLALVGGERFFTQDLAAKLSQESELTTAPILQSQATVSTPSGNARANRVQLLGIDSQFWNFAETPPPSDLQLGPDDFAINEALATRLQVSVGDPIIATVELPGNLSKDAPLSGSSNQPEKLRGKVAHILTSGEFGRYNLNVEQVPAPSLFLPLDHLQERLERENRINVILTSGESSLPDVATDLSALWSLADASLHLRALENGEWQLTSDRVFLDEAVAAKIQEAFPASQGVLSYLVNSIHGPGQSATPYSMAAARVDSSLSSGEAEVTDWLAEDLQLNPGDEISLDFFVMGNARQLTEESHSFRVARIVPLETPGLDPSWTPDFPGISDAESNADWEPGMPFDKSRIRKKDETYWDNYRTTPKLFLPLDSGQELWANRFGSLTALRFPAETISSEAAFRDRLHQLFSLSDHGILLRDLKQEAEDAVANSYDFGGLFAGMSFFLIIAALTLSALLFLFGIEQRSNQVGLLLALGHRRSTIRRTFLTEAAILAVAGASVGLPAGILYTRLALAGLGGAWKDAASGVDFVYAASPASLAIGWSTTLVLGLAVVALASRSLASIHPSQLLSGSDSLQETSRESRPLLRSLSLWLAIAFLTGALALLFVPMDGPVMAQQGAFFGGGFLLVLAGIFLAHHWLSGLRFRVRPLQSIPALGRASATRRPWRSLAIVTLMASGVFMVTAINSLRLDAQGSAGNPSSGTGGFQSLGESTLPIYENLNAESGRETFGLTAAPEYRIVQFRSNSGEDASCLNLNRAQRPRILAVDPTHLQDRFFFSAELEPNSGWSQLTRPPRSGETAPPIIPGILDQATAQYALGLKLGSLIDYTTSDGQPFQIEVVGLLDNSVLQGNIVIAESAFRDLFPQVAGYRFFLLEEEDESGKAAALLTRQLEDRGLEMIPAWRRLNEFNAVQNTYLSIFSLLGGLGLLLGTVGLAIIVSRNILERRGEMGLMESVGFGKKQLSWLIVSEHWFLHGFGVLLGVAAGILAVLPTLTGRSTELPWLLLLGINGAILLGGLIFCWWAARSMLRWSLLDSLRTE